MDLVKLLSANEIVAQGVCFILLLVILRVFLWGRFLKILDARKERIASDFRMIEAAKAEAEKSKRAYDRKIANIEEEAAQMIRQATVEGRRTAEEIRQNAQIDAERTFEKARDNIAVEAAKAEERLKNRIVDISIEAAEKVIEERLSQESDRKIVEKFIDKLKNTR